MTRVKIKNNIGKSGFVSNFHSQAAVDRGSSVASTHSTDSLYQGDFTLGARVGKTSVPTISSSAQKATMGEEVSISDAEKQFEDACAALYAAEAERDRLVLTLSRQKREVRLAEEAKRKASELLNSLEGDAPSSGQTAAAHADGRSHTIQVDVTIVGKDFLLPQGDETKLFRGVITAELEDQYRILYEDGEEGYLEADKIDEYILTDLSADEAAAVRALVAKHRQRKRAATPITPSPPRAKKKTKKNSGGTSSKTSTPRPRKLNLNPENEWEEDMLHWLLNVPHGSSQKTCSQANAQQVIRQARKLLSGGGIPYKQWPKGVVFAKDEDISLDDTDFDHLHKRAKDFENEHGKDKGNGWLLQHPIHKLKLYQEYRSEKAEQEEEEEEASI